jgi:hypothetical protein
MKRALAVLLLVVAASGCGFAVKHPAITAGIVGGAMGLSTCELASDDHTACLKVGGVAAALLGLVTVGALWLGGNGDESILQPGLEEQVQPIERTPRHAKLKPPAPPPEPTKPMPIPDYLKQPPELSIRSGNDIVRAPAEDQTTAATYAGSTARGPLAAGARITILTSRTSYKLGEEVRVIHVLEAPEPGVQLFVMGPKAIFGEYVDGVERTPPQPGPQVYDGRVLDSPGADFNYDITIYKFDTPGPHRIQWRDAGRESNVLQIDVAKVP